MPHPALEPMTQRLADQAMRLAAGDVAGTAAWVARLGGTVTQLAADEATLVGPSGLTVGIWPTDPVGSAIMLGYAIFGEVWPMAMPGLLDDAKRRWQAQRRAARQEAA